ncbi:MAG: LytTR family DNA-binding domain-containing protein [Bacteroidota bacterium]
MKTIKILIVEDESAAVSRLKKELNRLQTYEFQVLEVFDSIVQTVQWLESNEVDLIFMDIHLTDGLSFEIFNQIRVNCPVIFTTAYDEYALQAFKVNSIDYLLKPIDPDELEQAMGRYEQQSEQKHHTYVEQLRSLAQEFQSTKFRSSFLVSFRQKMMMIDANDVAYLYVKERGVFLKKKSGQEYVVDFFLDDLEKQLDPKVFFMSFRFYKQDQSTIEIRFYLVNS